MDQGEYIHDAAVREVYEETGIKTEFVSMVAMRQMANARWGKMDLYFVCLLRPLSSEIKIQQEEIHAAKWIDVRPADPRPRPSSFSSLSSSSLLFFLIPARRIREDQSLSSRCLSLHDRVRRPSSLPKGPHVDGRASSNGLQGGRQCRLRTCSFPQSEALTLSFSSHVLTCHKCSLLYRTLRF